MRGLEMRETCWVNRRTWRGSRGGKRMHSVLGKHEFLVVILLGMSKRKGCLRRWRRRCSWRRRSIVWSLDFLMMSFMLLPLGWWLFMRSIEGWRAWRTMRGGRQWCCQGMQIWWKTRSRHHGMWHKWIDVMTIDSSQSIACHHLSQRSRRRSPMRRRRSSNRRRSPQGILQKSCKEKVMQMCLQEMGFESLGFNATESTGDCRSSRVTWKMRWCRCWRWSRGWSSCLRRRGCQARRCVALLVNVLFDSWGWHRWRGSRRRVKHRQRRGWSILLFDAITWFMVLLEFLAVVVSVMSVCGFSISLFSFLFLLIERSHEVVGVVVLLSFQ